MDADIENKQIILRPSKAPIVLQLIVLLAVAIFVAMNHLGWKHDITFGSVALLVLLQLFTKSGSLSIGPDGFAIRSWFCTRAFRWSNVNGVWIAKVDFEKRVVWNCITEGEARMRPELNPVYSCDGKIYEGMLVDNYGMKLEKLAELLETTRQRHAGAQGG